MNFIDYWIYPLGDVLAVDGEALPLPGDAIARLQLADGVEYALVLTGTLAQPGGAPFEIAHLVGVEGGGYTLLRGQEGTDPLEWPAGTLVMATVTAAQLASLGAGGGDSGWQPLEPLSGYEYPPDARLRNGIVYLRGLKWLPEDLLGEHIALLPEGWLPEVQLEIYVSNATRAHRIYINPTGEIFVMRLAGDSGGDYIPFDNISFPVG
jgi:hypothetical protein